VKIFETKINKVDVERISKVLSDGNIGFGSNVPLFEEKFAKFSGKEHNIATNSASASAFMIFSYLRDIYGQCDVYTTSLGFASPAWAAKHFGHRLVFVDVNDELQFDIKDYREKRSLRCERYTDGGVVPVVMPVLYGGVSNIGDFDDFFDQSNYGEIIVVDSAHCATPTIKSDFAFFSFHPYKPICTSDGGMISTNNSQATDYFRTYRNFGRVQKGFSYDIDQSGFKFYMNNLNATIGLTQIERYQENLDVRKKNYNKLLEDFQGCLMPHDEKSSFYFATTLTIEADDVIINKELTRMYPMLHKTSYFKNGQELPNLELLHSAILNLPLWKEFRI